MTQKKREKKTSKGINGGGGKNPHLTYVQKILLGGGAFRTINSTKGQKR